MAGVTVERLLILAHELGITVTFDKLRPGLDGMADAGRKQIVLNWSLRNQPRLIKSVLAEEIGHILFPARPGHIRYHSTQFWETHHKERTMTKIVVAQDERMALDWAASVLMPDVEFWQVIKEGVDTIPGMMEYFNVEDWLVRHKVGWLRRKAKADGVRLKWRDVIRRRG